VNAFRPLRLFRWRRPACYVAFAALFLISSEPVRTQADPAQAPPRPVTPLCPPDDLEAGKFLVASRGLSDPNFAETVVLLVAYSPLGAMGLVINDPTETRLSSLFPEIEGLEVREMPVFYGGPVARRSVLFLLREEEALEECRPVLSDVCASENPELLERTLRRQDPAANVRVFAGHAGWAPRQLDLEVRAGGWYVLSADAETIFTDEPTRTWSRLVRRCSAQMARRETPSAHPVLAPTPGSADSEADR
jgi:putative transcriptional regulator